MKLRLEKYYNGKSESEEYDVLKVTKISENVDFLLVEEGEMSFSHVADGVNSENITYSIYKVQFIVSYDVEIAKNILVAYYIDSNADLVPHIISELPPYYVQYDRKKIMLIDYKSYCDICQYTNEKIMSLESYIEERKYGSFDPNSFFKYEDKYYNADEAGDIYDKIAGITS